VIVSEARIAANQRNAALSTGPKTPQGKERSRVNALKHGLCSSILVTEDVFLVQQRATDFFNTLKPRNEFHCWLVDKTGILSIRIDRCERMERRVRDKASLRSELFWEDDRKAEAIALGSQLAFDPETIVNQLQQTPQGCEWLMTRWAMLARSADLNTVWTPEQINLAFNLLGTPQEFRAGQQPGESIDFEGELIGTAVSPAVVARREVAALKERREVAIQFDEVNRFLLEADLTDDDNAELRRLRRYESTLHSRIRWCLAQLRFESPHHYPLEGLKPRWLGQHEPRPELKKTEEEILAENHPVNAIHPPFCIEIDELPEPGQKADYPAILRARNEKKLAKAEARFVAKRRKIEKLRA
jgi:hypothetical protein